MKQFFVRIVITPLTLFSLLLNSLSPLMVIKMAYAQEVTPTPVADTAPTPVEPTPTGAPEPTQPASLEHSPYVSPAPSDPVSSTPAEPTPQSLTPEQAPTPVPYATVTPTLIPTPSGSNPFPSLAEPSVTPTPSVALESIPTPTSTLTSTPSATPSLMDLLTPTPEVTQSAQPIWEENEDKSQRTTANMEADRDYSAPQNDKVKIRFTKLPTESGTLTIKEVKLTAEQVTQIKALSDTAFEITSTMTDGTFEYDLTLPLPPQAQNQEVKVKAAETEAELPNASELSEPKEKGADTITIKGLNHFTVFIITTPSPDTTQRVLINEIVPTAALEWVELFNNGTQPVNLAAGTGWTIRNSSGNTQSLSSLGTIPAAGRVVFDTPTGWLLDTAPETVTLLNELGTAVDTVTISLTAPGIAVDHYPLASESVGRKTDGVDQWRVFTAPTKGTANLVSVSAGTGLLDLGPIAPAGGLKAGFPIWYKDKNGLALDLMEAADSFGISDPVDPANPFSQKIGFNAEGFWWSADAGMDIRTGTDPVTGAPTFGRALLVLAMEAAFAGEAAVDGEQSAFARVRIRIDTPVTGTYVVTYPYGQKVYQAGAGTRAINDTIDIGCFALPPATVCDSAGFATALRGPIGPFLTWNTFNFNPALSDPQLINPANPSRRYVGNPAVAHQITGSQFERPGRPGVMANIFHIEGPSGSNLDGQGNDSIETELFTVTGRLADTGNPVITLFGNSTVSALRGSVYTDAGATCLDDLDGNCAGRMTITGLPVDTSTLGPKTVTYSFTDSTGNSASVPRTVTVVAAPAVDTTPPVITLNGQASVDVVAGTAYTEQNATASDDVDGDISANIVVTSTVPAGPLTLGAGPFTVTYNVSDTAGNVATPVVRTVNVVADTIPPVITVTPPTSVNILVGATYNDAGATCTDNVAGNCAAGIVTTGLPINTSVPGTHTITYSFTDAAGNNATAQRTVNVLATLPAGGLAEAGPISADNGYPVWYKDGNGIALRLCLAGVNGLADPNCVLPGAGEEPNFDPVLPVSFPGNFPGEAFWWIADSDVAAAGQAGAGRVRFRYALESAFTTPAPAAGEQIAFLRVNLAPISDLVPGATYTVTHPFGQFNVVADPAGSATAGTVPRHRDEDGAFTPPLTAATAASFLGAPTTHIGPFLKQVTPAPPAGYIGDGATLATIDTGPNGNFVRIDGPSIDTSNYDGDGNPNSLTISTWTIAGKKADMTPPVITLSGVNPFSVTAGTAYVEPGATCSDDFDGNCTAGINTTSNVPAGNLSLGTGPFTVTYSTTDRSGNTTTVLRTINVVSAPGLPVLSTVHFASSNTANILAKEGDTVTLTFTAPNLIQNVSVRFNGRIVTVALIDGVWTASLTLTPLALQEMNLADGIIPFTINFTDSAGVVADPVSGTTDGSSVTFDKTAPVVAEVTAVSTPTADNTPNYTFSSTEAGAITYGGDCSSVTSSAVVGNNTVTFNSLANGPHNNCTVVVTDQAGNASATLNVTPFTVNVVAATPTLPSVTIASNNTTNLLAKVGDVVTLTFTSSTLIQTPVVTIAGTPATVANTVGNLWTATQTLTALNTEGVVPFTINFTSIEGVAGAQVSATTNGSSVIFDKTVPVAAEVIPVTTPTTDSTPDYTFSSTENGTITYGGDCLSVTSSAVVGNNAITFNTLAAGAHNNCTIRVTDAVGNAGAILNVTPFTVNTATPADTTLPSLAEVAAVITPTADTTPNYTFSSTEAGAITYGGDCSSTTVTAVAGNNTITFNALASGLHNNCTIRVTDQAGNGSNVLNVAAFTIQVSGGTINQGTGNVTAGSGNNGQAGLPAGSTNLVLGDSNALDVAAGISTVVGGTVNIAGVSTDLANFSGGDLSGRNLATAQTVGDQTVQVGKAVRLNSGVNSAPIVITNNNLSGVTVSIPDGATVFGPTAWDGTILSPRTGSSGGVAPTQFTVGNKRIEVGSSNSVLLFDRAVTLTLTGVTGEFGFRLPGGNWQRLTATCGGTFDNPASPAFPGECVIANGTDTKIVTYHFTTFADLATSPTPISTPTPTSAPSSGGSAASAASSGGGGGSGSAPVCNDTKPGGAPTNLRIVSTGPNEVTLAWDKAADPVTYYLLAFGLSSGNLQFGNPNIGGKDTTSYTVKGLSGGVTYYFKVRGGNNCMPGDYSSEVSVRASGVRLAAAGLPGFQEGVLGVRTGEGTGGEEDSPTPASGADVLGTDLLPTSVQVQTPQNNLTNNLRSLLIPALLGLLVLVGLFKFIRKIQQ